MVSVDELVAGQSLPDSILVNVTSVDWDVGPSRRAEVELTDEFGTSLRLIDYSGAEQSVQWKQDHHYRIADCNVASNSAKATIELAPSKRTTIQSLGKLTRQTSILFIGDTHVGRTSHPDTGEQIDPIGAFKEAIEHGLTQDVSAVVHLGDIFHDTATASDVKAVKESIFEPLEEATIPFYFIRGNHHSDRGYRLLEAQKSVITVDTDGVSVNSRVRIFGINHNPTGDIALDALPAPESVKEPFSILLLHQTVQQLSGEGIQHVDLRDMEKKRIHSLTISFQGITTMRRVPTGMERRCCILVPLRK